MFLNVVEEKTGVKFKTDNIKKVVFLVFIDVLGEGVISPSSLFFKYKEHISFLLFLIFCKALYELKVKIDKVNLLYKFKK